MLLSAAALAACSSTGSRSSGSGQPESGTLRAISSREGSNQDRIDRMTEAWVTLSGGDRM